MAIVNDVCLLAAILSNLCDDTDTLIHSVPKHYCKCIANNTNFNSTVTIWMPPSSKLTMCHVTKAAGIDAFFDPKK